MDGKYPAMGDRIFYERAVKRKNKSFYTKKLEKAPFSIYYPAESCRFCHSEVAESCRIDIFDLWES